MPLTNVTEKPVLGGEHPMMCAGGTLLLRLCKDLDGMFSREATRTLPRRRRRPDSTCTYHGGPQPRHSLSERHVLATGGA